MSQKGISLGRSYPFDIIQGRSDGITIVEAPVIFDGKPVDFFLYPSAVSEQYRIL